MKMGNTLSETKQYAPPLRFVTAASLFDGHDASINIIRRILQQSGAEVIHLGHNRSVYEIVMTALQEDVQGIAISSYQGGHLEYFKYMIDMLRAHDADHIRVFGGGGGVIIPDEIRKLHDYGVQRVYSPEDGHQLGLQGMIDDMLESCSSKTGCLPSATLDKFHHGDRIALARVISAIENYNLTPDQQANMMQQALIRGADTPVLGITGTGGAGKSSLTDEIILRFRLDSQDSLKIAVLAIDPTRRKTGGALLGDRIRMNAIYHKGIFMRSLATRCAATEIPDYLADIINAVKMSGFDLIIVETPGIGQGDAGIVPLVDIPLYVMTPEFGAASQLEKIDMLDFADAVAINKFDRKGAEDARRDVAKQLQRNRRQFSEPQDNMPVYGTIAAKYNDTGVTALYQGLLAALKERGLPEYKSSFPAINVKTPAERSVIIPPQRQRYLGEIAAAVRQYHEHSQEQADIARQRQQLQASIAMLQAAGNGIEPAVDAALEELVAQKEKSLDPYGRELLEQWPALRDRYQGDEFVMQVRDKDIRTKTTFTTLSGTVVPRITLPRYADHGELLSWLMRENLPGYFPFTAGVFPFKRENEDPTRMFAGEGDPFRTNRRFKNLSEHSEAKRLSTAFDSVTLYGFNPDERPDIYGKVGNSGVSIATLDDMKALYDGFDLCDPDTSVSMTINGPAPAIPGLIPEHGD